MGRESKKKLEIRQLYKRRIFSFICERKETSRQEIAYALRISMPTVLQNVRELCESGYVQEVGQYESTGGRKATIITSCPDAKLSLGIDITKNYVDLLLVDLAGAIKEVKHVEMPFAREESYYKKLGELAKNILKGHKNLEDRLHGVGISVPGIVDEEKMIITYSHALGFRNLHCSVLSQYIPWPAYFINDANAAIMAELHYIDNDSTMAYLSLSNSVGGAVIINGELYKGINQRSCEFGHMRLIPHGKECYCGQLGCLDAYCSALVLSEACGGPLDGFFQKLNKGDPELKKVWETYLKNLAVAVINLRMAFDCDIMLGGYVGGYIEPYLPELRIMVGNLDTFGENGVSFLKACKCKQKASAFGAALQPINDFINHF
ncbi:MAG TPA: ROK family transcriptional regulator [Clostridiaceae bacterium]|jgi:N-acetylglucosamine repressor|nr:ROK family transcriptional regulator [Clostridiaceae bacterium]